MADEQLDLVKRLRGAAKALAFNIASGDYKKFVTWEAADEIERLRAEINELADRVETGEARAKLAEREALWRELWKLRTSERRFEHMDRLHELVHLLGLDAEKSHE